MSGSFVNLGSMRAEHDDVTFADAHVDSGDPLGIVARADDRATRATL